MLHPGAQPGKDRGCQVRTGLSAGGDSQLRTRLWKWDAGGGELTAIPGCLGMIAEALGHHFALESGGNFVSVPRSLPCGLGPKLLKTLFFRVEKLIRR